MRAVTRHLRLSSSGPGAGLGAGAAWFLWPQAVARLTLCSLHPQPTPIGTMHSEVQVQPPSRDKAQPHTKHQVSGSAASPGTSCSSQPRCWGCIPVADRSLRVGGSSWGCLRAAALLDGGGAELGATPGVIR